MVNDMNVNKIEAQTIRSSTYFGRLLRRWADRHSSAERQTTLQAAASGEEEAPARG